MEIGFYPGFTKVVALDFNSTSLAWKWIARANDFIHRETGVRLNLTR